MNALSNISSDFANLLRPDVRAAYQGLTKAADTTTTKTPFQDAVSAALKSTKSDDKSESDTLGTDALGRDQFLQLLVLQMQNQDPMSPTDNTEMIAQLAQFSALEQMQNLNESFQYLSGNIDQLNFINASNMVGKEVTGIDINGDEVTGVVDSVGMEDSIVYLMIGDNVLSMAGVTEIKEAS
ncbi:MAG: flagellar biosynthesis protein FlgD [Candidatus Hydrogenedentes bacterium]|nr:flagellar biosynthesis protein FlgD [Candidatus Hydrogenedentota bacterium]